MEEGGAMEMVVEEEGEGEEEEVFVVHEIDLDYEYDAPKYFDFTRDESPIEAREAETWFFSAQSYPPSPFVVKLVLGDDLLFVNVNVSPKSKEVESTVNAHGPVEVEAVPPSSRDYHGLAKRIFNHPRGIVPNQLVQFSEGCHDHKGFDKLKAKTRSTKPSLPRSSTLMKPTASQLAKQNIPSHGASSRYQMLPGHTSGRNTIGTSGAESQAAKRQKLEGGHLCKVFETKPINLIHKEPRKDGKIENSSGRLRLTIPREFDLETAHRAQKTRPKNVTEVEPSTVYVRRFKARPLNRKIFESPSLPLSKKSTPRMPEFQEFHLKTSERAMQHASAAPSTSTHGNDNEKGMQEPCNTSATENGNSVMAAGTARHDAADPVSNFKAHPLNKKILSSKGDLGVFRNNKRETTVPVEFNFQTDRRVHHRPPTELFNKLSLGSELQPCNGSTAPPKTPKSSWFMKGSKENRLCSFPEKHEVIRLVKEKPVIGMKDIQSENDNSAAKSGPRFSVRSWGIR